MMDDLGDPTVTAEHAETDATATRHDRPVRRSRPALRQGSEVGRYIVETALGQGGMGVVYRAHDPELGRDIALKLVRVDGQGGPRSIARERLLREAQALARLSHPNVIAVHDVGTHDGDVFLAMELVEGVSLRTWLAPRSRPWRQVLDVMVAAGRGLAAAHAAGVVHRDVKPDNVMIGNDARVRVLDFGLARAAPEATSSSGAPPRQQAELSEDSAPPTPSSEDAVETWSEQDVDNGGESPSAGSAPSGSHSRERLREPLTIHGAVVGTPPYMSPEHERGEEASPASDQFSFCVTAWEALYGQRPFLGDRAEVRRAKRAGDISPPPRGVRVPASIRRTLERGLAPQASARHATMDALLARLVRQRDARRRWATAGVAAVAGGLTLGMVAWLSGVEPPSCRIDPARLDAVWGDTVRARLREGFVASRRPHAADSADRVATTLDAHLAAWTRMREASCLATRRGEQSAEALDLRARCLDDRLAEVGALTTLLVRSPDGTTVDRAVEAVRSLPPIERCADLDALRAIAPLPTEPARRARIDDLHRRLDALRALERIGRYEQAFVDAEGVVTDVRADGYRPLLAAALAEQGSLASQLGKTAIAHASLSEAARVAASAHDDEAMASALVELVWLLGLVEGRYDEAAATAIAAEAAVTRAGDPPMLRAALSSRLGMVRGKQGKYAEAATALEHSIAIIEERFDPDEPRLAATINMLGEVRRDQGEHEQARALFARALAIAEAAYGPSHPDVAAIVNNLGASLWIQGRFDEARPYLERSLRIDETTFGPDHARVAVSRMNVGGMLYEQGRLDEALPYLERAIAIQRKTLGPDHPELGMALHNLGALLNARGDHAGALAHLRESQAILERALGPDHPHLGFSYVGIADVLVAQHRAAEALPLYEKALAIQEKGLGADNPDLAYALTGLGRTRVELGRSAAAVGPLERAVTLRETHEVSADDLSTSRFLLAQAVWQTGDRRRAADLAARARDALPPGEERSRIEAWLRKHAGR